MWVVKWELAGIPGGGSVTGLWEALGGPVKTTCKLGERVLWCSVNTGRQREGRCKLVRLQGDQGKKSAGWHEYREAEQRKARVGASAQRLREGRHSVVHRKAREVHTRVICNLLCWLPH